MGKMVSEDGSAKNAPRRGNSSKNRVRVEWKGYISPTLDQSEKRVYAEWRANPAQGDKAIERAVHAGYKISVDFQPREGAYRAGLYCQDANSPNAGWCLTCFAGDWYEAACRVVFMHFEILGCDWTKVAGKSGWKDDWVS